MPKNLICKNYFKLQCILGKKIKATIIANTCATEYGFIDERFAETIYYILKINK